MCARSSPGSTLDGEREKKNDASERGAPEGWDSRVDPRFEKSFFLQVH